ncbi:MAG TPA: DUF488 domain-containing protein [Chitinophagaceae bacterium]|nr:DUF488 domain-containing protein [Chitinophagaceae bacterium]
MSSNEKVLYSVGHSTRTLKELIEMLQSFSVEVLVDIRSYPGSRRYPHFNKENLIIELPQIQFHIFIYPHWVERENLLLIQKIQHGSMMLSVVMRLYGNGKFCKRNERVRRKRFKKQN